MGKIKIAIDNIVNRMSIEGKWIRNSTAKLALTGVRGIYEIEYENKYVQFTRDEVETLLIETGSTLETASNQLVEKIVNKLFLWKIENKYYDSVKTS